MLKTRIALGALLMAFALAPAGATRKNADKHAGAHTAAKAAAKGKDKGKAGAKAGAKATASKGKSAGHEAAKGKTKGKGKTEPGGRKLAAQAEQAVAAPVLKAPPAERRQDRSLDSASGQFLGALWRLAPESAIAAGKYDSAAILTIPDQASREQQQNFLDEWQGRFARIDARQLSSRQRTDLALLTNKLNSDRWYLNTFREYEWNPALYNIASPIDFVLHTEYAAQPQRLRTLLKRIAGVPAYYAAARASLVNPTREHTRLALEQAPGVLAVLGELDRTAQASILSAAEKQLYSERIGAARKAVEGYMAWLGELDKTLAQNGGRSFRIGKELYEQKFIYDIQAGGSAEQLYQKALLAREQLLVNMEKLADELWGKTMGGAAMPAERQKKIAMVIDKLSASHVARADFLPAIRRQIPELQDWVVSHKLLALDPAKSLVVRETPAYQRGAAGARVEAPGPYRPLDRTYYNVTPLDGVSDEQADSTLREYNQWMLPLLNIHEAIPGHYTQKMYANKSPSIVKSVFGNSAMMEGWAVYSERMMLESGYGGDAPEMWLMYSKWNLRSVTNTILDYSVHVLGMTHEQALDLLVRQAFQTPLEAEEKWRRVQLSAVQLSSYFSGYSDIMELREQRRQALGARFALKDFHEQFLSYGSAPVRVIRELMQ